MFDFTGEEKKVMVFILGLAFCGLVLSYLIKINCQVARLVYPAIQLAKLNLNKVSLSELVAIKRVSLKLSQRIIEYRNLHQGFGTLAELKDIKGIGDQRYEKLKELFFVE